MSQPTAAAEADKTDKAEIIIGSNPGQKIETEVILQGSGGITPQPPDPPIPPVVNGGDIDKFGVKKLFPSAPNPNAPDWYIDLFNKDDPSGKTEFAVTYGHDMVKSTKKTEGNLTYFSTPGHIVNYNSGAPSGMSFRGAIYPDKDVFDDSAKGSWDQNPTPEYLHTPKSYGSFEMTWYIRVGPRLKGNPHTSLAAKVKSKNDGSDDTKRSCVEICMADPDHADPYVNINFAHDLYVKQPVKVYTKLGRFEPEKWLGFKAIVSPAADKKSCYLGIYIDVDPIDATTGKPKNNWILKADYDFIGVKEYKMIVSTWRGQKEYLRMDGYSRFDYTFVSIREIVFKSPYHDTAKMTATQQGSSQGEVPAYDPYDFEYLEEIPENKRKVQAPTAKT